MAHLRAVAEAEYPSVGTRCRHEFGRGVIVERVFSATLPEGPLADAYPRECVVRLSEGALAETRQWVCAVLVHEWGHVSGLGHSGDPGSIMYGGYFAHDRVPACNRLGWLEGKVEDLADYARRLRYARRRSRSRARVSAISRRLVGVRRRSASMRAELGP